jgi:hypothetical protein
MANTFSLLALWSSKLSTEHHTEASVHLKSVNPMENDSISFLFVTHEFLIILRERDESERE